MKSRIDRVKYEDSYAKVWLRFQGTVTTSVSESYLFKKFTCLDQINVHHEQQHYLVGTVTKI